jgi:hypothetical protein
MISLQEFYQLLTYRDDIDLEKKIAEWERFYNLYRPRVSLAGKALFETLREKLESGSDNASRG